MNRTHEMVTSVNLQLNMVTLTPVNDGKHNLATKEMKDGRVTCNGYFGERPVQVVTLTPVNEMR